MRFGLWITFIMIGCASFSGCADSRQKCGNKVLALWPGANGDYTFQEIQLFTLPDPYKLSGAAAKIYYESEINGGGFKGPVAEPRYTRSGDTCVPMDTASLMAVSIYAQFERLMQFERRIGVLDMLTWPRHVGVDIHVRSVDGLNQNNAHYFSAGDAVAILPYSMGGVPMALNQGVIAHEHFHGHFQRQVIHSIKAVESDDLHTPRGVNALVLRGWNEGLADLYGALYTGNPRYLEDSLSKQEQRALTAELRPLMSAAELRATAERLQHPKNLVALSYQQGAYLARLMYKIAHSGVEDPEQFLVRLLRRLKDIPGVIAPIYETEVIEFEQAVAILLNGFPRTAEVCASLRQSVSKELMTRSFSQCSAF